MEAQAINTAVQAGATASHFAIVPNNSTYKFSAYSSIQGWFELR